jgi:L,D-transpeptidase ErfK/SrfK
MRCCKYAISIAALTFFANVLGNGVREYPLPDEGASMLGTIEHRVLRHEDTLPRVAREEGVGVTALRRLNPDVEMWLPGEGTRLVLPTRFVLPEGPREGIVVNLSERRLYYFDRQRERLLVYPIGIGSEAGVTPLGRTRTVSKIKDPSWTPPASVRAAHLARGNVLPGLVPPGPNNPLGGYAIQLAWPGYFIHGTNRPIGVGGLVSNGCIRLYPTHIEMLATSVPNGTPVRIIEQPFKAAWQDGELYLEAHPRSVASSDADYTGAIAAVIAAGGESLDLRHAVDVARAARGVPEPLRRR